VGVTVSGGDCRMMVSNGVCLWWCMSLVMTVVVYVSVGDCEDDGLWW
jgi:hypothetical protein